MELKETYFKRTKWNKKAEGAEYEDGRAVTTMMKCLLVSWPLVYSLPPQFLAPTPHSLCLQPSPSSSSYV